VTRTTFHSHRGFSPVIQSVNDGGTVSTVIIYLTTPPSEC
jgi:hypothetical protein